MTRLAALFAVLTALPSSVTHAELTAAQSAMLARGNELRAARGLPGDRVNVALMDAAQRQAAWMARTRIFAHRANGTPTNRARAAGWTGGGYISENIAFTGARSVARAFKVWMNSGGHRANLMGPHDAAGYGIATAPNGRTYFVAMYQNRRSARSGGGGYVSPRSRRRLFQGRIFRTLRWWRR